MEQNNQQPQQNSNTNNNQNAQPVKPQNNQTPAAMPANQSKKNLIISGAVIIVVLAILLIVPHLKKTAAPATTDTNTTATTTTEPKTGANTNNGSVRGASTTQTRAEALVSYQGKMISVSDDCKVTPETQTQAKGSTILIDNSTTTRHVITVGPKSYTVSGLHYMLSWLNLQPGTLMITCDGKDTKSTIVVQ